MTDKMKTVVAVYLRMSNDKQEDSIERQLLLIEEYARRKNYEIKPEFIYKDEGIAGDELTKRKGLQQLLRDAAAGKIKIILCDERSRLSRLPSYDDFVIYIKVPLKNKGVRLETVKDGPVDWTSNNFMNDMMDVFQSGMSHEEVKQMARRVLSGYIKKARNGEVIVGPAPYGYRIEKTFDPSTQKLVRMQLIPDEPAAGIVRYLFKEYDEKDTSLLGLENDLNTKHIPPPRVKDQHARTRRNDNHQPAWNRLSIRIILTNIVYTGALAYNRKPHGKYVRFTNDKPEFISNPKQITHAARAEDIIIKEGTHEELVSPELFKRVQDKLLANTKARRRPVTLGGHLLSGLLICARCGNKLRGSYASLGGKGSRKIGPPEYLCARSAPIGRTKCGQCRVTEAAISRAIGDVIGCQLMQPDRLERLQKSFAETNDNNNLPTPQAIKAELGRLGQDIAKKMKSLHNLPEVVQRKMGAEIERDMNREKELTAELAQLQQARLDPAQQAADVIELGRQLDSAWQSQDRELIRSLLLANGVEATIYCDDAQYCGRTCYRAGRAWIRTTWEPEGWIVAL